MHLSCIKATTPTNRTTNLSPKINSGEEDIGRSSSHSMVEKTVEVPGKEVILVAAAIATGTCYPLDTIRRQMQLQGTPPCQFWVSEGVIGLYRGFVLKSMPNSSIKLTTFDI
ncbi:hypothetical protein IGI04_009595 [Brassica rapa subsp. trilocularis]|uniref:ADP,ATP carrier protein n=1 Tax=Brassica rapa subsp. trilocularis TaxID=1813537 RepID=A0ABQ7N041_BRACM|nr:hypothetical protein IGI04_009595 [Brassica rapa subsp. trilocularis]